MPIDLSNYAIWVNQGRTQGATALIVVYDVIRERTFPVFVMPNEDFEQKVQQFETGEYTPVTHELL